MDAIWSFDGSFGVSDSVASLRILTDSLPLVVNEPLFDRFFSGDLFLLIWGNSLVSLVLWGFMEIEEVSLGTPSPLENQTDSRDS